MVSATVPAGSVRECGKPSGAVGGSMRHDRAYKALFSHPLAVRDLLREFVAEQLEGGREWVERLDFSTLEPLPTERIDPTLRARTNDLVWRVRFRDPADGPEWLHVLLILEFQSSVDWFMALRVQGYAVRLLLNSAVFRRQIFGLFRQQEGAVSRIICDV